MTSVLCVNCGSVLPLFIYVHIDTKKSLKRLVFTRNSEINLSLTSKGGIDDIFLLYKNQINIDQYVLGAALGSLGLLVNLIM